MTYWLVCRAMPDIDMINRGYCSHLGLWLWFKRFVFFLLHFGVFIYGNGNLTCILQLKLDHFDVEVHVIVQYNAHSVVRSTKLPRNFSEAMVRFPERFRSNIFDRGGNEMYSKR